jgi:polycomb protein EED
MLFTNRNKDINDLAISPINPQILASASADNTVRLWNLDSAHQKAPCMVVCAGEGHTDTVLSIAFHASGRYLLSGGQDHVVSLWRVPVLPVDAMAAEELTVIHYPLFSTSEVHSEIVDCVSFHGDLVLSKAYQEKYIVLWRITGFDSSLPTPASSSAPTNPINNRGTRSAFSPAPSQPNGFRQYLRLLQFSIPECEQFYMCFSLSSPISSQAAHPILAICNSVSQVFFWDFARFDEYHKYVEYSRNLSDERDGLHGQPPLPPWLISARKNGKKGMGLDWRRSTEPSNADSAGTSISLHTTSTDTLLGNTREIPEGLKRKYETGSPLGMVEAHWKETVIKSRHVVGRQVAWSACGRWCVAVAEPNVISILEKGCQGKGSRE